MSPNKIRSLSIQWHLTTRCGNRCRHCYMYDESTYETERQNELDLTGLRRVLERITEFEDRWDAAIAGYAVSGGDPLLHPDWAAFMRELKARSKTLAMMGNPETLTDGNLATLAELELEHFQLSLDGLEQTHDYFRGEGRFQQAVEALDRLSDAGIPGQIMFTLYPENRHELVPLLRFVATQTPARRFCFDIGTCAGNAASLAPTLGRDEVKAVLAACLAEKARLAEEGYALEIVEKNRLLQLIRFEQRTFFPFPSEEVPVAAGCYVGWTCVPILSDGTVLACRRFPLDVGKLPEQSFEEIFLGSQILRKFRRAPFFSGCGTCDFYQHCRGCPAIVHGLTGDPFAPHPLCFRRSVSRTLADPPLAPAPRPLDTSLEEEHDLVASHFLNVYASQTRELLERESVSRALLRLSQDETGRQRFVAEPDAYLSQCGLALTGLERLFVQRFVTRCPPGDPRHAPIYRQLFVRHFLS